MEQADSYRIPLEKMKRVCDCASELSFCSTSLDVAPLDGMIGQERAVRSMTFGLAMDAPGYNIIVAGQQGDEGTYPEGTVFGRADRKLRQYHEQMSSDRDDRSPDGKGKGHRKDSNTKDGIHD